MPVYARLHAHDVASGHRGDPIDSIVSHRRRGHRESTPVSRLSWIAIVVFAVVVLALAVAVGQPARAECEAQGGQLVFSRASGLTCQLPN
jgi:hypothetical protein